MEILVHTHTVTGSVEKFDIPIPAYINSIDNILIRCVNEVEDTPDERTLAGFATVLLDGGYDKIVADAEVYFNDPDQHISISALLTNLELPASTFARVIFKNRRTEFNGTDKIKVYLITNKK